MKKGIEATAVNSFVMKGMELHSSRPVPIPSAASQHFKGTRKKILYDLLVKVL